MGEGNSKIQYEQNTQRKVHPPNRRAPPVVHQQTKPAYSIDDYADCVKTFCGEDEVRPLITLLNYLQRHFVL